jgi:signal transduction histidine kinase
MSSAVVGPRGHEEWKGQRTMHLGLSRAAASAASRASAGRPRRLRSDGSRNRVMIVEDERIIRESLGGLLEEEGYEITFAENGQDALNRLRAGALPDIIVLDLRMPVMDGWEFRAAQKEDPRLRGIPVIAVSADRSAPAVAISAQAYLRKPLDVSELLRTLDRILFESEWNRMSARLAEAERLASLGRVAAGVGHEINNPLTFAVLNVSQSLDKLGALRAWVEQLSPGQIPGLDRAKADLNLMVEMLGDSRIGMERIGQTVGNLQRLSRQGPHDRGVLELPKVIEQSIAMVWNQIRHRARLTKHLSDVPPVRGDAAALGQVFLNLLINAAQAIPEGDAEGNEIFVGTSTAPGEVIVEVRDTGQGIAPEDLPHVFEPFFTTKAAELGTGLGLSISRQTVTDHGGRIEIESEVGKGTVFRVHLPMAPAGAVIPGATTTAAGPETGAVPTRARILVIDDEPLMGRVIRAALTPTHDVVVVSRATEAFERLAADPNFDLVLCDLVMPDVGGPEVYATLSERWPRLAKRVIFMTGGAFTPATKEFLSRGETPLLAKPFHVEELTALVRQSLTKNQEHT